MIKKFNAPRLRFPGFTDEWEQRKLGDIATITGGGTPSTNISEYWNGDIDWYSPVEIGEKRYASGSIRKITKLGLEKSSAKILPVGTVLFTSRAGIGNTAILQVEGCTNQGFQSITPNSKELDTYFLYTMTPKLKRYGEVTGAGSTFVEVSGKQMEQMNLMIPSLDEQKHVSQLFKVMDDAITLHQRKLNHLFLKKKSLLQKLFPKNGGRYPELRFPGFTDAWEQRKLGECMSSFAYGLNAAAKDYDGMHKYIRITDIDDETHNFIQSNLTSPDIDFNMDVSDYKLNIGDIVFARTGASVGKTYLYNPNDGDLYYAGFLIRGKVKEDYDAGFIYQNTLTKEYDSFIRITSQRSGQPGVNSKEYATFRLNIPCKDEQEKISKVLNNLDELFTLHQRKLNHLKLQKKALLQQLFV